jgi:hypothetical protein
MSAFISRALRCNVEGGDGGHETVRLEAGAILYADTQESLSIGV